MRQQVDGLASRAVWIDNEMGCNVRQPFVFKSLLRGRSAVRIDRKAQSHEFSGCFRYVGPVSDWLEFIVSPHDSFRFFLLRIPIKGCISTEEEIGDHSHCPDVHGLSVAGYGVISCTQWM